MGGKYREDNNNWKGGRSITAHGYMLRRVGVGHHLADCRGYAYEHRVVAEEKLGRPLLKSEIVHHKNGIRYDNRPENLEIFPSSAHHHVQHRSEKNKTRLRMPGQRNRLVKCRCGCGERFRRFDGEGRPRRFLPSHNIRRPVRPSSIEAPNHG